MKSEYTLKNDLDLTLDDNETLEVDEKSTVSEKLRPTEAMQEKFMQNCVEKGILVEK